MKIEQQFNMLGAPNLALEAESVAEGYQLRHVATALDRARAHFSYEAKGVESAVLLIPLQSLDA